MLFLARRLGLIAPRIDAATIERLEGLIATGDDDDGEDVLALIKSRRRRET